MRDYFNGKRGLSTTYWVGVFGVNIITGFVFRMVNKGYLTIQDEAKFAQLEMFHNVFLVVISIYMMLMVRAMFKAGYDGRSPGGWGWGGIILTIISALYISYVTLTVLFPSVPTPRFMLDLEIRQINKQLPQEMGDGFSITWVEIVNDVMIYRYKVEGELTELDRKYYLEPLLETPEGQEFCEEFQGYFSGSLKAVSYVYQYDNTSINADLLGSECLTWLDQR